MRWKAKDVAEITETTLEATLDNGYYVWSSSLDYGEYIKVNLFYDKLSFLELDPKKQYTDQYVSNETKILVIAMFSGLLLVVIGLAIYSYSKRDPYLRERGFIVRHYHIYSGNFSRHYYKSGVSSSGKQINPPVTVNSGGHYGGGGGCACACACACAGGGRAGCSMKDFYHTNLSSDKVIKAIADKN